MQNHKNTYYIKTFGCAMNYSDSERIKYLMEQIGYTQSKKSVDADVVILNSCSIRQQAEDKVIGWGQNLRIKGNTYKDKKQKIILTGCMATRYNRDLSKNNDTQAKQRKLLKRQMPWLDEIVKISEINNLPVFLGVKDRSAGKLDKIGNATETALESVDSVRYQINADNFNIKAYNSNNITGLFPISTGCDNFCSYCIVPYTRGGLNNYPEEMIISAVKDFVGQGGKLVTLLGQNVNSWRSKDGKRDFVDLLKEIIKIDGEFWINFLSSNPMDFTNNLCELIATDKHFVKSVNLAVQSGSDKILKLMNRRYKADDYLNIVKMIKKIYPQFRITTDIIVGFPGEERADFEETLKLLKSADIDMVYLGKFSPRNGTVASKYSESSDLQEKKARENEVYALINQIRIKHNKKYIGKYIDVLITGGRRGLTYYNHEVVFINPANKSEIGKIVKRKVIEATRAGLVLE